MWHFLDNFVELRKFWSRETQIMQEKQEKLGMRNHCGETNALQRNNFGRGMNEIAYSAFPL